MKIKNENTTITAVIITVLIYVGLFTIIPILTSKLSVFDQLRVFLNISMDSTIKNDITIIMEASSKAENLNCSKLQPFLKSKCTQIHSESYNIASAKNTHLISYNISRHPLEYYKNSSYAVSRYSKDTYDIEIKIIASGKKIDSIYSSLESLFITTPKHQINSYKNSDGGVIYLENIKYSDLKVSN